MPGIFQDLQDDELVFTSILSVLVFDCAGLMRVHLSISSVFV